MVLKFQRRLKGLLNHSGFRNLSYLLSVSQSASKSVLRWVKLGSSEHWIWRLDFDRIYFFAALKKQKQEVKKRGSIVLMIAEVSDGDETPDASQASFSILVLWDL